MDALSVIEEMPIEVQITCALAVIMFLSGVFSGIVMERRLYCQHEELEKLRSRMEGWKGSQGVFDLRRLLVEDWLGDAGSAELSMDVVADALLQRASEERSFIEERVRVMSSAVRESHEGSMLPPLEDLEQLTREKETSRRSYLTLRGVTAIMLMLGICGTLWSVHGVRESALSAGGYQELARCLLPSMICIVIYVFFVVWQGALMGRFERVMKSFDELTICHLIPAVQPKSPELEEEEHFRLLVDKQRVWKRRFEEAGKSFDVSTQKIAKMTEKLADHVDMLCNMEMLTVGFLTDWQQYMERQLEQLKAFSMQQSEIGAGAAALCLQMQCYTMVMNIFGRGVERIRCVAGLLGMWGEPVGRQNVKLLCTEVSRQCESAAILGERLVVGSSVFQPDQISILVRIGKSLRDFFNAWDYVVKKAHNQSLRAGKYLGDWEAALRSTALLAQGVSVDLERVAACLGNVSLTVPQVYRGWRKYIILPLSRTAWRWVVLGTGMLFLLPCVFYCVYYQLNPIVLLRAEMGSSDAQYDLGLYYYYGKGVNKDMTEAVELYRKAAEQGNAEAQCNLGNCYYNGEGVSKDMAEAVRLYRLAAEQGYARGQYNLGVCYEFGKGVSKDMTAAVRLYRLAAEQGHAQAQVKLGLCYYNGNGVSKNSEEAVKWWRKSADQGNALAQNNLGDCYENGKGVSKDPEEAVKWYRKAADQGYALAQFNLGLCYAKGSGESQDMTEAVKWWRRAADQGDAWASVALSLCCENDGVSKDVEEELAWYRKAAERGDAKAQFILGWCHATGWGESKDMEEAVKWYRKAAEQGNATAQFLYVRHDM